MSVGSVLYVTGDCRIIASNTPSNTMQTIALNKATLGVDNSRRPECQSRA